MKTVVDDAVITLRRDFSEADRLIELLTYRHGRVFAFAAKAKSSHKRFGGGLGLGSWSKVWLRPRVSGLWRLEKVELVESFPQLRKDLEATAKAMYALELCREVFQEGEAMGGIFSSFIRLMKRLQRAPGAVAPLMRFELSVLRHAGWSPRLHVCERCNANVLGQPVRVLSSEGVVCVACSTHADNSLLLSKEALVILLMLQRQARVDLSAQEEAKRCFQKQGEDELSSESHPLHTLLKHAPEERHISEMRLFLDKLWLFHLGKELKARLFMDEIAD